MKSNKNPILCLISISTMNTLTRRIVISLLYVLSFVNMMTILCHYYPYLNINQSNIIGSDTIIKPHFNINITDKLIINKTLPNYFGGFGNFLESYYHKISCHCLSILNNSSNITSFDETTKISNFNRFYYHFVEFVPQGLNYIHTICEPFLYYIKEQQLIEYFTSIYYDICLDYSLSKAPWRKNGLIAYYNDAFIKSISNEFNNIMTNYYNKYNESDNIILNDCDITIHARIGDNLRGNKGCWPRAGFFAVSYFIDSINAILSKIPQCMNVQVNDKKIYIVTQLSDVSVRNNTDNQLSNLTNQIIYMYSNEIDTIYGKYGYSTQIISTSIINDWNILRRSNNLICVTSTYCHTASIANIHNTNSNIVLPLSGLWHNIENIFTKYNPKNNSILPILINFYHG